MFFLHSPYMTSFFLLILFIGSNVTHNFAHASPPRSQVSASVDYLFLKHVNYNIDGYTLNIDKGWLPGVQLAYSNTSGRLKSTFAFAKYRGDVNYDGQISSTLYSSTTTEDLSLISYRLDKNRPGKLFQFFGMASFQRWNRNILSPNASPQNRQYQWLSVEGGLRLNLHLSRSNQIYANVGISRTFFSRVLLDLTDIDKGKPLLDLSNEFGASVNLIYQHNFTRHHRIQFFSKTNYWRFGRSNTRTIENNDGSVDLFTEPRSETLTNAIGFSYLYRF